MPSPINGPTTADKIVLSAAQLFARQGYRGTSTREISRLAGVSENTLFRHFDHKEDLFWSALVMHARELKIRRDLQDGMARVDPPEFVFPKIMEVLEETVRYRPELLRLIAVAFLELPWKGDALCQEFLSPLLSTFRQYLEGSMKQGKLRDLDPTMLTTAVTMSVLLEPGIAQLLGRRRTSHSDAREASRAQSRFWLDALLREADASTEN